jgi:hypothetical protein
MSVIIALYLTNALAYYIICTLGICNVFIVQAPEYRLPSRVVFTDEASVLSLQQCYYKVVLQEAVQVKIVTCYCSVGIVDAICEGKKQKIMKAKNYKIIKL